MNKDRVVTGMLIEETSTYTFIEVCSRYHIPKELLVEMIEQGFFEHPSLEKEQISLEPKELRRIESAFRLHRDLGINLPGVTLALDLLEQMESMRQELEILRKHF